MLLALIVLFGIVWLTLQPNKASKRIKPLPNQLGLYYCLSSVSPRGLREQKREQLMLIASALIQRRLMMNNYYFSFAAISLNSSSIRLKQVA
ncbi:hypothetical protein SMETH2_19750 [Serratia marcescens]|nr:hypothetical protein SMETH2_19750 [Serratia marcescens]